VLFGAWLAGIGSLARPLWHNQEPKLPTAPDRIFQDGLAVPRLGRCQDGRDRRAAQADALALEENELRTWTFNG